MSKQLTYTFSLPLLMTLLLLSCSKKSNTPVHHAMLSPSGSFMGIEATDTPVLLYPDFINTPMGEYNGTFNPEGTEFFYTVSNIWHNVIVSTSMQEDGNWSKPEFAPFSVKVDEFDPLFSPDGQSLYYSSHRPIADTLERSPSNIWKIDREDNGWSEPVQIPLYGPARGNYFSSLTHDGELYFNIWNTGNMYKASPVDTGYIIEQLGDVVNSSSGDGDPFIAPDESYLIFRSRRDGGLGVGDLWITFNIDSEWTDPQNLGEPINSRYHEMCPYVTTDGKLFIFSSGRFQETFFHDGVNNLEDVKSKLKTWDNGQQNIYAMSASFIEEFRKKAIDSLQ